jgi:DNA repair exonuclease SbcCD ATPase subunit
VARAKTAQSDVGKHLRALEQAKKKYDALIKKAKPGKDDPNAILGEAKAANAEAVAKATEVEQTATQLATIDAQLEAVVKVAEETATKAQADAEAAKQFAEQAKLAARDVQKKAQDAQRDLAKARWAAGLGSETAFAARRKHDADALAALKAKVQAASAQLNAAPATPPTATAK